ncbi:hypothetical protein CDAR_51041 [Caerostris darwini]|uniref:Uncharacterized protein n=1 Tax=Caerostris darwini TaxID=1538125 RepID=A0AAV4U5X9_9ARAC|nr:hypothetical protein CDAR_51041 [Caerostris darwini]
MGLGRLVETRKKNRDHLIFYLKQPFPLQCYLATFPLIQGNLAGLEGLPLINREEWPALMLNGFNFHEKSPARKLALHILAGPSLISRKMEPLLFFVPLCHDALKDGNLLKFIGY